MAVREDILRTQLVERRLRLQAAAQRTDAEYVVGLLREVDAALERMNDGSYGLCEVCHDPVEQDRLLADPLVRLCLDHLTEEQQHALEQDLELASRIQGRLLPEKELRLHGWEMYYHYEPAGPVSGDYCDIFAPGSDGAGLLFLVGDVAGKGISASMLMAHLHAMFRSLAGFGLTVGELMRRANRVFCESTLSTHFATLVCGRASASGEVEICNAGHCPVLLLQGGKVTTVDPTGLPVGLFAEGHYSVGKAQLAPGDGILLYTDGLLEVTDGSNTEYGTERLCRLASEKHALAPRELIDACLDDVRAFVGTQPLTDDLTAMLIRRL